MKFLVSSLLIILAGSQTMAAELSPGTLVGRYKVEAKAGFQKVYMNFRVLNTQEFELQRTYPNGNADEVCNGSYTMAPSLFWDDIILARGKTFQGSFTCPSNRSRTLSFNIDFENKTTDDLVSGTSVTVTSSMAPGRRINAYVKKQ